MIRPKSSAKDLPPRMLRRKKVLASGKVWIGYYYNGRDENGRRKEIPLGPDLNDAKRKWAELEGKTPPIDAGLMRYIFDRYERNVIPTKAPRTRKDNIAELKMLRKVFDTAPIDLVTTAHLAQYRDQRGVSASVRANRELALFSHVFNMAREWGYTSKENPCRGLRKNKETPRSFYADDEVFNAVHDKSCQELKDAMILAYLTGQRPADVLNMRWADVQGKYLEVSQGKTGKRLKITIEGRLANLIDEIRSRKISGMNMICTPSGVSLNKWTLRVRFQSAKELAIEAALLAENIQLSKKIGDFQFRDIRPKAASEMNLSHAKELLGHSDEQLTRRVYQRVGSIVSPAK